MRISFGILAGLGLSVLLAACGGGGSGGGSSGVPNAKIEGTWQGSSGGNYPYSLSTLILENGEMYVLYGSNSGGLFLVNGFLQGSATVSGNTLTAPVSDYNNGTKTNGTMNATVLTGSSISGTISFNTGSTATTFSIIPTSPASSTYNYNEKPNIDHVTGDWTGSLLNGGSVSVNISANGDISGSNQGCNFSGKASTRSSGKNVFNMTITFGASPCAYPGQSVSGIAIEYALNSSTSTRQLIALMQDSTKAYGYMFFAQR